MLSSPHGKESFRISLLIGSPVLQREVLSSLEREGYLPTLHESAQQALDFLAHNPAALVIADHVAAGSSASTLATHCQRQGCLLVLDPAGNWQTETPPFAQLSEAGSTQTFIALVQAALRHAQTNRELVRSRRRLSQILSHEVVGQSPVMTGLRQVVTELAASQQPVFLVGESGTGKRLIARMIHAVSDRAHAPMISVNCRILPSTQLDRDLFVPEDLAAETTRFEGVGRLAGAQGGVLILEEVDQLSLPLQVRLLRTLEGTPGGRRPLDIRVIALSRQTPEELVRSGQLREDFARFLSQRTVSTPPLRNHMEDLCGLVERILSQWAIREGRPVCRLMTDALQVLQAYNWPGNVQELQGVVERACAATTNMRLTADDILPWMSKLTPGEIMTKNLTLAEMERRLIEATFAKFGGNREKTAQALDIGLRTLSGKLRDYGYPPRGGPGSNIKVQERRAA